MSLDSSPVVLEWLHKNEKVTPYLLNGAARAPRKQHEHEWSPARRCMMSAATQAPPMIVRAAGTDMAHRVSGSHHFAEPLAFASSFPQSTIENLSGAGRTKGGVKGDLVLLPGSASGLTVRTVALLAGNRPTHQGPELFEQRPDTSTQAPLVPQAPGHAHRVSPSRTAAGSVVLTWMLAAPAAVPNMLKTGTPDKY
eukprot:SAG31_NODE_1823_length_7191_cov_9.623519_7_plen_196_part_00